MQNCSGCGDLALLEVLCGTIALGRTEHAAPLRRNRILASLHWWKKDLVTGAWGDQWLAEKSPPLLRCSGYREAGSSSLPNNAPRKRSSGDPADCGQPQPLKGAPSEFR
jgi:hypothetical protein